MGAYFVWVPVIPFYGTCVQMVGWRQTDETIIELCVIKGIQSDSTLCRIKMSYTVIAVTYFLNTNYCLVTP